MRREGREDGEEDEEGGRKAVGMQSGEGGGGGEGEPHALGCNSLPSMDAFAAGGAASAWGHPRVLGIRGGCRGTTASPKCNPLTRLHVRPPDCIPPLHPPSCKSTPKMQLHPQIAPPPHPPGCNLTPQTAALGALRGLLLPPPAVQRRSDGVLLLPMWSRRRHTWLGDSQGCNYHLGRGSEGKGEQRRGCRGCRG